MGLKVVIPSVVCDLPDYWMGKDEFKTLSHADIIEIIKEDLFSFYEDVDLLNKCKFTWQDTIVHTSDDEECIHSDGSENGICIDCGAEVKWFKEIK